MNKLSIRIKLVILLLILGGLPALGMFGAFTMNKTSFVRLTSEALSSTAAKISDSINRNLFERYGDVQAFGYNAAAHDEKNWKKPSEDNPLVVAMNNYVRAYGFYPVMMLLDLQGELLAVNTRNAGGKEIDTKFLYGQNYKDEPWFQDAAKGNFLQGKAGLTGTAVQQPAPNPLVAKIYNNDGLVIAFSAPVTNHEGKTIGVWVNFADFSLVEGIVGVSRDELVRVGVHDADIMMINQQGQVILDYDPDYIQPDGSLKRDYDNLFKKNFISEGLQAAKLAVSAETPDYIVEMNPDSGTEQLIAYAPSVPVYDYPGLGWSVLIAVDPEDFLVAIHQVSDRMLMILAVSLVISLIVSILVGYYSVKPLSRVVHALKELSEGHDIELPPTRSRDEIGQLVEAFAKLRISVLNAVKLGRMIEEMPVNIMMADPKQDFKISFSNKESQKTLRGLESHLTIKADQVVGSSFDLFTNSSPQQRAALADPTRLPQRTKIKIGPEVVELKVDAIKDLQDQYIGPMLTWSIITRQEKLADDFEQNVLGAVNVVGACAESLEHSSQALASTAERTTNQSLVVSSAAEEATANVQTVAAASEELAASVSEILRQVSEVTRISNDAVKEAAQTSGQVQNLSEAAQKIGEVVDIINTIAGQTNLLALNATIEAARAGEAGKGFAVVASEVKNLANQTAKATEDITRQVSDIQSASKAMVGAIESIRATIEKISGIQAVVAAAVEEQGAATQEISRNVQEASVGTRQVSENISSVTNEAQTTGREASEMSRLVTDLAGQAESLKDQVNKFLVGVRSA